MASRHVDDFDDDGYDDEHDENGYVEEGGDELSPEDQVSMAEGTAKVREALGSAASKVTLAQIQEALWHYYYDIDKSVAYLTKTYIAPTPAPKPTLKPANKKLPEGMSNMFSCFEPYHFPPRDTRADHQRSAISGRTSCYYSSQTPHIVHSFLKMVPPRRSLSAYFSDMPWLDVPEDRQTVFIAPERPRGGLLGGAEGAPPMTKLQKLAAARKKKSDEKKENTKIGATEDGIKKLSLSDQGHKESVIQAVPAAKRQKLTTRLDDSQTLSPKLPEDRKEDMPGAPETVASSAQLPPTAPSFERQDIVVAPPRATPSAFARTLIGSAHGSSDNKAPTYFPMPYTFSASFSRIPFNEPSPDDVVLAAQAKGSSFARTK